MAEYKPPKLQLITAAEYEQEMRTLGLEQAKHQLRASAANADKTEAERDVAIMIREHCKKNGFRDYDHD